MRAHKIKISQLKEKVVVSSSPTPSLYRGESKVKGSRLTCLRFNSCLDGMLLSRKEKRTIDTCNKMDGSPGTYAKWKNPIPQGCTPNNVIYTTFLKWQSYRNEDWISGSQGLREVNWCRYKSTTGEILVLMEMFVFWLQRCQYPSCTGIYCTILHYSSARCY